MTAEEDFSRRWKSPVSVWTLLAITSATIHIQAVGAAVGANCSSVPAICDTLTETCDNGFCECADGYTQDAGNGMCRLPGYKEQCNPVSPGCQSNLQCDSTSGKCQCGTGQYDSGTGCETTPDDDDDVPVAVVGGIIATAVAIIVIVTVVAVVLWRRRRRRHHKPNTRGPRYRIAVSEIRKKRRHRPIKIASFRDHVTRFHKNNNLLFKEEFKEIKIMSAVFTAMANEALSKGNWTGNRFMDRISGARIRVAERCSGATDYINTSSDQGIDTMREYFAIHNPIRSIITDFWPFIWEKKCKIIVMLSDFQEQGKRKVDRYWPKEVNHPKTYGSVVVEVISFHAIKQFVVRKFKLTQGNDTRTVTHLYLSRWEESDGSLRADSILEFINLVRQEGMLAGPGPIIVHCRADEGGTGVFIALDYLMPYLERHTLDYEIDIFNFVLEMRRDGLQFVQTESQYMFIYDAVKELIEKRVQSEVDKHYICAADLSGENVYEEVSPEEKEPHYYELGTKNERDSVEPEYEKVNTTAL